MQSYKLWLFTGTFKLFETFCTI